MGKFGGNRNFGFGKQLTFAGKNALKDRFVAGHYSTVASHSSRWNQFAQWSKDHGVRDARDITRELIEAYGRDLKGQVIEEEMKVAYAQNMLSTVNVVLSQMRGDADVKVSPSDLVGKRSTVRTDAPIWMDRNNVQQIQNNLIARGNLITAAMGGLARDLGMRFREASLFDPRAGLREAERTGKITVSEGVKGGGNVREVPITSQRQIESLRTAANAMGSQKNMMAEGRNYKEHRNHSYNEFYAGGGRHFHDMRAAYACDRYQQLTGHLAPVLRGDGDPRPSRDLDRSARATISKELGHHRIEVVGAYIGGHR